METRGNKYQAGRTGAEIAKLIRSEIRTACKTEGSPLFGCKVSVRFEWATHSKSIEIRIMEAPVIVLNAERVRAQAKDPYSLLGGRQYSAAGEVIAYACEQIALQYNQVEHRTFYLAVEFDYDLKEKQAAAILAAEKHPACCGCADCEAAFAA